MQWNSSLELGIENLDTQHKEIIDRINRLSIALDSEFNEFSTERLEEAHKFLEKYVAIHFREEEEMAQGNYPDIEAHIALHHSFESELTTFQENLKKSGLISHAAAQLIKYLSKWFITHIKTEDPKYLPYIK
jgi:hemerythrin-like metal-binding protein